MAETITGVNPALLRWARRRSGLAVADVAKKMGKASDAIVEWEAGASAPTYVQLEKLAYEVYRRPVAMFFFPEPPDEPDRVGEFRTLPDAERDSLHSDTRYAIRIAQARQLALNELNAGRNRSARRIFQDIRPSSDEPLERLAREVREYVGVTIEEQVSWPNAEVALERWRSAVEECGALVFKRPFRQKTISGFSLTDDEFPVIFLNNGNTFTRQLFTLWHEVAHLLFKTSGVTVEEEMYADIIDAEDRDIEVAANRFAAEFLTPTKDLDAQLRQGPYSDDYFGALADRYNVSREVVLRRHRDRGLVSGHFYDERASEWADRLRSPSTTPAGGNYFFNQVAYLGRRYLELVFGQYYQGRIDLLQTSNYLDVKAKNIPGVERAFLSKVRSS